MGFLVSQHGQLGAIPPPPFLSVSPLESMRSGGAIPPPLKRCISAMLARYPMKTREMGAIPPSAILSRKGIARYGGVSRTGPLSVRVRFRVRFQVVKVPIFGGFPVESPATDSKLLQGEFLCPSSTVLWLTLLKDQHGKHRPNSTRTPS